MAIDGELFYHLNSRGPTLVKLTSDQKIPMQLAGDIRKNPAYKSGKENIRIITNRFKRQAFAYLNQSIYLLTYQQSTGELSTRLLIADLDVEKMLIHRMLYDELNGVLLLGSISKGLFLVRQHLFSSAGQSATSDVTSFFYAQAPYSDSAVVTAEGFVSGSWIKPLNTKFPISQDGFSRFSIIRDKNGGFWGVETHGVYYLTQKKNVRHTWHMEGIQPTRLYQGMGGQIWIGSSKGEVAYLPHNATPDQGPTLVTKLKKECTFLHQDQPGRLWIGTSSGLYLYDSLAKATYPVKGLNGKTIRSIFSSRPDRLWVTTYGDGIFLLTGNSLYKMPLDDKGYLAYAHCILKDNNDYFWISANKGLFRTKERELLDYATRKTKHVFYLYYSRHDGFLTNEFNGGCQPCAVKLGNGNFSFPTMSGLVWFKPEKIPLPDLTAPIRLEDFILDDQAVPATDTILLPYNFKHFSLRPITSFLGQNENVQFYYSMHEPSDSPLWKPVPKGQRIDVYHTTPGTYRILVRQVTGFGGKYVEQQMVLIIKHPWMQSWWFISLAVIVLGLGFWLATKWRVRNLEHQNALLTKKVEERTAHLSRTLDELKTSDEALQTQLQIQMRIIGAINHDLHAPLRYLSQYVPRYLEKVSSQPDDPETIRLGASIGKSTLKVYGLADELLQFIKTTYNKKGKIARDSFRVKEMLEKKIQFFNDVAIENQVAVELSCSRKLMMTTNRVMTEIVIHNLIDNAMKHTHAASIRITAEGLVNGLRVAVAGSGFGMEAAICDWLNQQTKPGGAELYGVSQPPANLGLGLIMLKEITTLLDIDVNAISTNEGTTISLIFSN